MRRRSARAALMALLIVLFFLSQEPRVSRKRLSRRGGDDPLACEGFVAADDGRVNKGRMSVSARALRTGKKTLAERAASAIVKELASDGYRLLRKLVLPSLVADARQSLNATSNVRRLCRAWASVLLKVQLRGVTNPPSWEEAANDMHLEAAEVSLEEEETMDFRVHFNWRVVESLIENFQELAERYVLQEVPVQMFECARRDSEEVESCLEKYSHFAAAAFRGTLEEFSTTFLLKWGPSSLARNLWILTAGSVCPFEAYSSPAFIVLAWAETPTRNIARFVADMQEFSIFSPECEDFKRRMLSLLRNHGVAFSRSAHLERGREDLLALSKRFAVDGLFDLAKKDVEKFAARQKRKTGGVETPVRASPFDRETFYAELRKKLEEIFSEDYLRSSSEDELEGQQEQEGGTEVSSDEDD